LLGGKLDLSLFGFVEKNRPQTIIPACLALHLGEKIGKPSPFVQLWDQELLHKERVEIASPEIVVPLVVNNLQLSLDDLNERNVEGSSTQIVYDPLTVLEIDALFLVCVGK
jgi:hypothetical protein